MNRTLNFCAGPASLPIEVLNKISLNLINHNNIGYSILEMSHRSPEFSGIINEAEKLMIELLDIPSNYKVLFLQGGATGQFSAIPLNLINCKPENKADYVVTGIWSQKAAKEATKYGNVREVFPRMKNFTEIPDLSTWSFDPEASYIYYCANETVNGVEFHEELQSLPDIPIICDMSSNILTKEIPISKFGLIYASAQKNLGCAGVTVVIVREDLLNYALPVTPSVLNYKVQHEMKSLYNTPPTFSIYVASLILQWLKDLGGMKQIQVINIKKSAMLYKFIDESEGFYKCPVNLKHRSRVNVVFRIKDGDEELESLLVKFAKTKYNIIEVKGHRLVGGIRISLYNSISLESVKTLIDCLTDFKNQMFNEQIM